MGSRKRTFGIFIGRFQPMHNAHLKVMLEGLELVNHLIILLGGARASRSAKNPFTAEERREFITASLLEAGVNQKQFTILEVQDYYYNEQRWLSEVQAQVMQVTKGNQDITLLGYKKDNSSYYLLSFPEWSFTPTKVEHVLDATTVRKLWYENDNTWGGLVPLPVREFMDKFSHLNGTAEVYVNLQEEANFITAYKKEQEAYPWPIIFVTVDPVVVRSGHVLVVKRGGNPGKGTYALPGGFLNPNESILEGTIRELTEETKIKILPQFISEAAKETRVFDAPGRSQRGRTITHATLFDLGGGQLPFVSGGDDAAEALWLPINEVLAHPELFYEDHFHIIYSFVMRF